MREAVPAFAQFLGAPGGIAGVEARKPRQDRLAETINRRRRAEEGHQETQVPHIAKLEPRKECGNRG